MLFFSHSWRDTESTRDVHARIVRVARIVRDLGFGVWVDEHNMGRDVDWSMFEGVLQCTVFVCFVTSAYVRSVQDSFAGAGARSNCFKEWTLACQQGKTILPVFLDNSLDDWRRSVLCMYTGSNFRVEAYGMDNRELAHAIAHCLRARYGMTPRPALPCGRHRCRKRGALSLPRLAVRV